VGTGEGCSAVGSGMDGACEQPPRRDPAVLKRTAILGPTRTNAGNSLAPSQTLGSLQARIGAFSDARPIPPLHVSPRSRLARAPVPASVGEGAEPVGVEVDEQLDRKHDCEQLPQQGIG
jgi:hypothetical protein